MKLLNEVVAEVQVGKFYVYVLYKPNGVPFYVGKGFDDRIVEHEADARREKPYSKNRLKISTIRKIWRSSQEIKYSIDSHHEAEADAHNREIELIAKIGRKCTKEGPLTNITAGGEGFKDIPESLKKQISEALVEYYTTPQHRIDNRLAVLKYWENNTNAIERARKNAVKNKSHESLIKWMVDNPELHREKLARHSGEMKEWHANNRERTKEIAAKRNEKFRTSEHREHMSEKTREFAKNNPEAVQARLDAVAKTNKRKRAVWEQCLEIMRLKLIEEGKLDAAVTKISDRKLYEIKKLGLISKDIPSGFSKIEKLESFLARLKAF